MRKKVADMQNDTPRVELQEAENGALVFFYGDWTVYTMEEARRAIHGARMKQRTKPVSAFNLNNISRMDTSGALLINSAIETSASKNSLKLQNDNLDFQAILDLSHRSMRPKKPWEQRENAFIRVCGKVGNTISTELALVVDIISFFGQLLSIVAHSIRRPKAVNPAALVNQLEQTGIRAVPIIALLNFLIGLVIAYMAAAQLVLFGAQIFVVNLLAVGVLREMGVLITAIMVAGRSGSAFTAQIGAMVTNEEVRAMRCMGIDPMLRLVLPRVLALMIVMPFLVIIANIMALLGGMFAMWFSMDISPTVFVNTLHDSINIRHLMVGLAKAPFFAIIIASVGCFLGFKVSGSTDSIGTLTTRSVVESIFLVITWDAVFALILTTIGV